MNQKTIHIDEYAVSLLMNKDYRKSEYNKFVQNCYLLKNVEGNIDPEILSRVIRMAKWNRKLRSMLTDILCYADSNSVRSDNFQLLLRFSQKYRKTYLEAIAHTRLAFCQMQVINRLTSSYEAFAWLFDQICEHDFFREEDMLCLLKETSDISICGIQHCINGALEKLGESPKIALAQNWIDNV